MKFFRALDGALIRLCTRVSHFLQTWIGITNFFIAKIGLLVASVSLTLDIVNYFHRILSRPTEGPLLALDVYLTSFVFVRIKHLDKAEEESLLSEERAKYMFSSFMTRMLILIIVTLQLPYAWRGTLDAISAKAFGIGLLTFCYFSEVTPLPPRKSKARQLIERFSFGSRHPTPVGSEG